MLVFHESNTIFFKIMILDKKIILCENFEVKVIPHKCDFKSKNILSRSCIPLYIVFHYTTLLISLNTSCIIY